MESLSMLGLTGQARAPTQALGYGALIGPPGATVAFPWEVSPHGTRGVATSASSPEVHAAFAALLEQLLSGATLRQAPGRAAPGEAVTALASEEGAPSEEEAQRIEEGPDGANAAQRPRTRRDAQAPEEPVTTGTATALTPMPLDLTQEAASSEPAPEPSQASAGSGMTVTAVPPSGATNAPATMAAPPPRAAAAASVAPAQGSPAASRQASAKADVPTIQDREAQETSTADAGPRRSSRQEAAPAIAAAAVRADEAREARRPRLDSAETAPRAAEPSADPATRAEGTAPARAAGVWSSARAGSDANGGAEVSPDVEGEITGEPTPTQGQQAPSADLKDASDAARPPQEEAPTRQTAAAATAPGGAREARRPRLDSAETAPRAAEPSADPATRAEGTAPARAAGAGPGPAAARSPQEEAPTRQTAAAATTPGGAREARRPRLDSAETAPRAAEPSADPATRAEGTAPARAAGVWSSARAGSDANGGAEVSPDVEGEITGEPTPTQGQQAPSADLKDASDAARPAPAASAAPAPARDVETERPGRRQRGAPAEGTPEVLPGSAHATVVQWLHGSERVDEGQALQQAQRILVTNLVEDIRRLTFVGQSRAVLQLQPPELGKLSIHLSMQNGGLSVEMVVETEAVKAIVESTLGQLQSALAQHGLATAGVFVQVGQSAYRDAEAWQTRRGREVRSNPPATGRIEGSAPPPQVRLAGFGTTVDYRI